MKLFSEGRKAQIEKESPLANRMRPRTLEEYIGQTHIVGPGRLLRRAIQADQLSSLIFYGPPGVGKTTLANVIAESTQSHFITINAVLSGVKQIREAIETAQERRSLYGQRTTLFVDEVHRWNKAQQDALLPHVENGMVILIGATTENPYFEVNKALVSRSRIFQLKPLTAENLRDIAYQALADEERGFGKLNVELTEDALAHLVNIANGDARGVLNALDLAVDTTEPDETGVIRIDLAVAEESIQKRAVLYDKDGDSHYDTISAFIKSMRGSDPDAALYWMAKMVYAGEDPRFIFRRMAIFASEDVGLAAPEAVGIVMSCWQSFERIGMPEGQFPLSQACLYLATAPKSNSSLAFFDAFKVVEQEQEAEVPNHLKDGNRDSKGFGHGKGYQYPHAHRNHWVAQQYLPTALQGKLFYQPTAQGQEAAIQAEVGRRREAQLAAMLEREEDSVEVLTTSPTNRAREQWLKRAVAGNGRFLSQQREHIFEFAKVQRHHLLLDANAGSGLLMWEGMRQTPEGGVYALAKTAEQANTLRQQVARMTEFETPIILEGQVAELAFLLALREESDLRFDRIVGRNLVTAQTESVNELAEALAAWLAEDGRLVLGQTIPRHTQRIYDLVAWPEELDGVKTAVVAAEEAIYQDEADPMVNWDETTLQAAFEAAGLTVSLSFEEEARPMVLDAGVINRWFPPQDEAEERPSYKGRLLAAGLDEATVQQVARLYRAQLQGKEVGWKTAVVYLQAKPLVQK